LRELAATPTEIVDDVIADVAKFPEDQTPVSTSRIKALIAENERTLVVPFTRGPATSFAAPKLGSKPIGEATDDTADETDLPEERQRAAAERMAGLVADLTLFAHLEKPDHFGGNG
jgi:hypothetical protein